MAEQLELPLSWELKKYKGDPATSLPHEILVKKEGIPLIRMILNEESGEYEDAPM
jgi:hypothetical protein